MSEDPDRSGWLATVLSMTGRPCVNGKVPMFEVTANIRDAGKSMLVDVASVFASGHTAARTAYATDDNEMRKRITACVIAGSPAIPLDNIDRSVALDASLTGDRWKDRKRGSSRTIDLPLRMALAATGNNIRYRSDVANSPASYRMHFRTACRTIREPR